MRWRARRTTTHAVVVTSVSKAANGIGRKQNDGHAAAIFATMWARKEPRAPWPRTSKDSNRERNHRAVPNRSEASGLRRTAAMPALARAHSWLRREERAPDDPSALVASLALRAGPEAADRSQPGVPADAP